MRASIAIMVVFAVASLVTIVLLKEDPPSQSATATALSLEQTAREASMRTLPTLGSQADSSEDTGKQGQTSTIKRARASVAKEEHEPLDHKSNIPRLDWFLGSDFYNPSQRELSNQERDLLETRLDEIRGEFEALESRKHSIARAIMNVKKERGEYVPQPRMPEYLRPENQGGDPAIAGMRREWLKKNGMQPTDENTVAVGIRVVGGDQVRVSVGRGDSEELDSVIAKQAELKSKAGEAVFSVLRSR